jgi:hypothetical protein
MSRNWHSTLILTQILCIDCVMWCCSRAADMCLETMGVPRGVNTV